MGNGGARARVFAGPRDDGFYVDIGRIFDLANLRAKGTAQDDVAGYNCHAIALDIPTGKLTADGQVPDHRATTPSSASGPRPAGERSVIQRGNGGSDAVGPWVQVSRLGLPLINEAVIGLQDKDKYNRTTPVTDVANFAGYFLNPIIVRDAEAVGIYNALGVDPDAASSPTAPTSSTSSASSRTATPSPPSATCSASTSTTDSGFPNGRVIYGRHRTTRTTSPTSSSPCC